jgi:hypothetical protein
MSNTRTLYRAEVTQHPIHDHSWTWEIYACAHGHTVTFAQAEADYSDRNAAHDGMIAFAQMHGLLVSRVFVAAARHPGRPARVPRRQAA